MRPAISEFSFGYAVTEEIIRQQRAFMIGAPIFPSLIREGGAGGGYDLQLNRVGFPIFLQFKLSHRMVKSNSIEIKDHSLLTPPFFRIHLMPLKLSQQHNMLLELDNGTNEVYYVAPFFTTQAELNHHYTNTSVLNNSVFIRPRLIGALPDDEDHHISLEQHSDPAYLFSKKSKKLGGITDAQKFMADMSNRLKQETENVSAKIDRIIKTMLSIINKRIDEKNEIILRQVSNLPPSLGLLTYLSHYYFDSEVLLALKE